MDDEEEWCGTGKMYDVMVYEGTQE